MKTISIFCYIEVPDDAHGLDTMIQRVMTGNLKIGVISRVDKPYDQMKGIEYRDGKYVEPVKAQTDLDLAVD